MGGIADIFTGGPDIPSLGPARQVELQEFGGQIAPTAIPESFGGQGIATAIGEGAQLQGQALQDAIAQQQAGFQEAQDIFGQTQAQFDPFISGGTSAFQEQAALSGALGPQAQQQAVSNIQVSPGQQFLRDRAQKALQRTAAARGDLGGGRTALGLQEQAIGFGMQDLENQFNRLGQVSQAGQNFLGQQAGLGQNLAQQGLGVSSNIANALAQQGQVGSEALTGAAGALSQEQLQQFAALQNQHTQQAQQQAFENQFNLGQQGIDLQNVGNQMDVDRANFAIAQQNAANAQAGLGNVIGLGGTALGFAMGGPLGAAAASGVPSGLGVGVGPNLFQPPSNPFAGVGSNLFQPPSNPFAINPQANTN
ncbi:MAG: hypothetical protein E2O80_06315 [Betaproteobacteria bacterium]|nr:MAG: hypothetical protein E2O80_06315 [Betaproteobacteria bacterium]